MEDIFEFEYHESRENFDVGKHGKDYEIEMSKFLFKRLMDMNYTNFKFSREKTGLGKFDDLVFVVEEEDRQWYSFVQLKHLLDGTKEISYESLAFDARSYFYLPKYFVHYLESSSAGTSEPNFMNAELESLIISTNIDFDDDLKEIKKISVKNDGIFKYSGSLYKLCLSRDAKRKIFSECYMPDNVKLAKELCMHFMLNKHIDVNNLIRQEHASLITKYHMVLASEVIDCKRKAFKDCFLGLHLKPNSPVFLFRKALVDCVNDFNSKCQTLDNDELKCELGITSKRAKYLKSLLKPYSPSAPLEFLKDLKLNVKRGFGEPCLNCTNCNFFPNSNDIDVGSIDTQIDKFLSKLLFAVQQNNNETLLRQEMSTDIFITYNDKMNQWYHNGSSQSETMVRRREWITKDKLVMQAMKAEVNFQNRKIHLGQILMNQTLLNSDILMRAFCSKNIDVGKVIEKGGEANIYYITRLLTQARRLHKSFLKEKNADIVFLTEHERNLNEKKISEFIPDEETLFTLDNMTFNSRFIFVGQDNVFGEREFDDVVQQYKKRYEWENVHWFEIQDNDLLWKKTHGSLKTLQNNFAEDITKEDIISEAEIAKSRGIIVIVGEPGMGKSTLLHHIAENMLAASISMWIIKVTVKDILYILDSPNNFKDLNTVISFISELENAEEGFSRSFLKYCLMNRRAIFMFDGFDELRTNMQEKNLINLIKCLEINCDIEQIWITTRPHRKINLENIFGVVSFSVKEISPEQQILFLSKFWMQTTQKTWHHVSKYSQILVDNLNRSLTCHGRNFLGIPLQTYMFAIVYMQEVVKDNPEVTISVELTSLFQSFLHTKYLVYFRKFGIISLPDDIQNLLMTSLDEVHQNFALCKGQLLPSLNKQHFAPKQLLLEDERLLEIGIVYKLNETFHFIHKTFCEYLTAKRFAIMAISKENDEIFFEDILKNLISNRESKFLLYLFDNELTDHHPLHKAVLQGLEHQVAKFQEDEMDALDCLKRSLHYYAVQYRHFNVLEILLQKKGCLSENDIFLVKATKAYLHNCYRHDLKSLQLTDQFFSNLFDSSFNFSLQIIDAFDIGIEMKRKNWTFVKKVLKARQVSGKYGNNIYFLELALKYESPIDIILLLLESIWINKDSLEEYTFAYSYFMNYLLICNTVIIEKLLRRYKGSFKLRSPLYVGVYEYFDLRNLFLGDCCSSLISIIERRARHYTMVVKHLLEHGASYILLKEDKVNNVFSTERINLRYIKGPIIQYIEENFKVEEKYFDLAFETFMKQVDCPLSSAMDDCRKVLQKFRNVLTIESEDTVKDVLIKIVFHILESSDASNLLYLAYSFHKAVENNSYELVREYFRKAKDRSWVKALLNSTNDEFRTPEGVAKSKFYLRIYIFLRKSK